MRKRKGRKLYTYRTKNKRIFSRKHPMRSALGITLTLVLAASLGVVGYSVVGPLVSRMTAEAEHPTQTDDPYPFDTAQIETTAAPETSAPVTSASETTQTTTTAETTVPRRESPYPEDLVLGRILTEQTAADLKLLDTAALQAADSGFTELVLPLKLPGGMLQYASELPNAQKAGAAPESPALSDLLAVADRYGLSLSANISLLDDQVFPAYFAEAAYQLSGSHSRWLDKAESDGGKPWLSPFSDAARSYLRDLVQELHDGGCSNVFCTDLTIPRFRASDVELVGGYVNDPDQRAAALAATVNAVTEAAPGTYFRYALRDAVSGNAEALQPDLLSGETLCAEIDLEALSKPFRYGDERYTLNKLPLAERVSAALELAQKTAGDAQIIPCFVRGGMSDEDLQTVISSAYDAGCRHLLIIE